MVNATEELMMSNYFLVTAVLGKHLEDGEKLFRALCKIFLIPKKDAKKLYRLAENETARAIVSERDYMQYQRIQQYERLVGTESEVCAEWEEVARIKGNAILTAQAQKLLPEADVPRGAVYTCLTSAAGGGLVSALRILGLLQCEGIFLPKNAAAGVKTLKKAADWNDCTSTLALLCYGKGDGRDMARVRLAVANTPFEELYTRAVATYGEAEGVPVESVLLEKSFNAGVFKRELFDPKCARIVHGEALSFKDKERMVFTQGKEQLGAISDLPLKLSATKMAAVDVGDFAGMPLRRETELAAVSRALKNSDLRRSPSYRPLCLCCSSKYLLNAYAKALRIESKLVHGERIYMHEIIEYDLEPTPNNVFVRNLDEDKDNRLLLFFFGLLSERKIEAAKEILHSARRAKFHLHAPNVTLDLSAVLPICFCDEQNAGWLKECCDEIRLDAVSAEELPAAVADIVQYKQKLYGVGPIGFDDEIAAVFRDCDVDTAEQMIDAAVRARRESGMPITLTREILQEHALGDDRPRIGFWRV